MRQMCGEAVTDRHYFLSAGREEPSMPLLVAQVGKSIPIRTWGSDSYELIA